MQRWKSFLQQLDKVAKKTWSEHSEPALMAVAVAAALVVGILSWTGVIRDVAPSEKAPQLERGRQALFVFLDDVLAPNSEGSLVTSVVPPGFASIDRTANGALAQYGMANLLQDYLVRITTDDDTSNDAFIPRILAAIAQEQQQQPYSDLPTEQRRALQGVEAAASAGDVALTRTSLTELASVLQAGNRELGRTQAQAAWSLPLGIISVILTVVLGLATVLRPISARISRK